jgi:hypothetical protein
MTTHTKVTMSLAACAVLMFAYPGALAHEGMTEVSGEVAGVSGNCPNLRFKVGEQSVATDANTDFDDGDCADVKNGGQVEVEGHVGTDGMLLAKEVDLDVM